MTDPVDYRPILAVIEAAIEVARRNPRTPSEPIPADDYVAWVICQELRRAGWRIISNSS